jgi:hypothetical protein
MNDTCRIIQNKPDGRTFIVMDNIYQRRHLDFGGQTQTLVVTGGACFDHIATGPQATLTYQ